MFGFFRKPREASSATAAKDRLQILLAHERMDRSRPDCLPLLQRDILAAIQRHLHVGGDDVEIKLERAEDLSTLEINIELPGERVLEARSA
ncbi:MAG TPA: cell division topological specificity factor MinE [Thermohalobaculum sp.]|nr:cell division topological specificity factor MinE [Thermohalobaculum sp.]